MRIISGILKGKKLFTPLNDNIRPTSDRTREAIFNVLYSRDDIEVKECDVLDVFSGTGAFGLEAISRGAKGACFVDIDLKLTKKNAKHCGFDNVFFIEKDVRKLPITKKVYDLVFMDAPYNKGLSEVALKGLLEKGYLAKHTLIIVETERNENINLSDKFEVVDERIYGLAKVRFLKLK